MKSKIRVYIAGPYSQGNVGENVRAAILHADMLKEEFPGPEVQVYVPHLNHLWHLIHPHDYQYWLSMDFAWLMQCTHMLRLPGDSPGADDEEIVAGTQGIPVFHNFGEAVKGIKAALKEAKNGNGA